MTAKEPLSYEPAGSSEVICSVVPIVRASAEPPLSPPPPAVQPARVSAATEKPATATNARRRTGNADVISVYLFLIEDSRADASARRSYRTEIAPDASIRARSAAAV